MHSVRSRRLIAAVAVPLLVGTLAACGSDDSKSADQEPTPAALSSSPSDEQSSESAPAEETDDVQAGDSVDPHDFTEQVKDALGTITTAKIHMEATSGPSTMTADGRVNYRTNPPSIAMTMQMTETGGLRMELRLVGNTMYMKMGKFSGGKFMAFDLDDPNSALGDTDAAIDSMDPTKAVEKFEDGVQKVVFVGEETVDGEDADHYRLTIDSSKLNSQSSGTVGMLPKTVRYDMWLDDEGRLRRSQIDMGKFGTTTVTTGDFDAPVKVTAPPSGQVTSGMGAMTGAA
ncbi:MAG: LppX_LprAFG lipoprotein [Nocardioides sp.]|uniref:LppX_LprAFG lipoprotein n=1 Tax=Nocardioides sp. TaxID=35761 RepID=UPI0039E4BA31